MRRSVASRLAVAAMTVVAAGGCDSSTGNKEPKVTLSTSGAVSVAQGGNASILVFINRQNFAGTVTLSVAGASQGVTALLSPSQADASVTSRALVVSAAGNADPGKITLTVKATGDGIPDQTITVDVTVTVTGDFALGVEAPSLTVAQGGGGIVAVLIPRTGNNAGDVTLDATGLPAGLTATFSPSPSSAATASMILAATAAVPPGTYSLTITGTSPGLSNHTTTLSVLVVSPPATTNVSIPFCADDMPVWFAYQNEGFPWKQVPATGTAFTFAASQKVGIAVAFSADLSVQTNVFYLSRAELTAFNDRDCSGPKSFTGKVDGLSVGQSVRVVMGATAANASSFSPSFTLSAVNARPLDLVATRGTISTTPNGNFLATDRMIIRRGLDLASGTALSALDFAAGESFAPAVNNLTITGLVSADDVFLTNTLWTGTSTFGLAHSAELASETVSLNSTPAAQMVAGDLHELSIEASQSTQSLVIGRQYVEYFGSPADRAVPLGPQLASPTVTIVSSAPYSRLRAQLPSQPEYNTSVEFGFVQDGPTENSDRIFLLGVSAAYLGGTPTTWSATIPDFTGTAGLNNTWMLAPRLTTVYFAQAYSGRTDLLFGAQPALGDIVRLAYRVALTNTIRLSRMHSLVKSPPEAARKLPRYVRVPQYLRR